jgi:hypothetical protein
MAQWNGKGEEAQVDKWIFEQEQEDIDRPIGIDDELEAKKNEP